MLSQLPPPPPGAIKYWYIGRSRWFRLLLLCFALFGLRPGLARLGLAWLGLAWLGLAWLGLAWLGLVTFGLVGFDLVWFRLAWLHLAVPGMFFPPGIAFALISFALF